MRYQAQRAKVINLENSKAQVESLLDRVAAGDEAATHDLLTYYRDRLRQMVCLRLAPKISRRLDASDVIQDTLLCAATRLSTYARERPIAFYPWLWQIAQERLIDAQRRHSAQKRDVSRECELVLNDDSISQLAQQFAVDDVTPSKRLAEQEKHELVSCEIERLPSTSRNILAMKYLEGMSHAEIADALELTIPAVKSHQARAIKNLHQSLIRKICDRVGANRSQCHRQQSED